MKRFSILAISALFFLALGHGTAFAAAPLDQCSLTSPAMIHEDQSPQAANSGIAANLSRNWSGYVAENTTGAQDNTYSSVTGTWIVPSVTTSEDAAADATWVGIGGMSTNDLIQAGTQTITENGQILYQAWYEVLPNVSIPVSLSIKPGDSITTTLQNEGNASGASGQNWLITIVDNTTGQEYQTTVTYASSESSAEWIEEMPATTQGYIALDDFGSVPFTQATAVVNGVNENLTELGAQPLTLSNGEQSLSVPSSIGPDSQSFIVTRTDASSDIAPEIVPIYRGGFSRDPRGDQGFSYSSSTTQPDGNGGEVTRYIRYFVIPLGAQGTTTQVSGQSASDAQDGSMPGFQYSFGNGTLSVQWDF